jgi:hypothetical protein
MIVIEGANSCVLGKHINKIVRCPVKVPQPEKADYQRR